MAGTLYIVATPIGNLEDMTPRGIRVLREADLIAAEDTRGSIKLLNHFDIHTPMTSYHEYNKISKAQVLVEKLLQGEDVAVVTDAGTPGISDPGEELVRMALKAGITVSPVPGACALVSALVCSGKPTRRFCFEAFLPADKKERSLILEELKTETRTIVMYEAPHRLIRTLQELLEVLGDREITLCRELTKRHETFEETTIRKALARFEAGQGAEEEAPDGQCGGILPADGTDQSLPRGEYVLVIAGRDRRKLEMERQQAVSQRMTIPEHVQHYLDMGMDRKSAMKAAAKDRGISRRDVYQALLQSEAEETT